MMMSRSVARAVARGRLGGAGVKPGVGAPLGRLLPERSRRICFQAMLGDQITQWVGQG